MKNIFNLVLALTLSVITLSANAALPTYTFTDLGTLGGTVSDANAINNINQVVGNSFTIGDSSSHATLWSGSTTLDLTPGIPGFSSVANDINESGQIAGNSIVQNSSSVWAWRASIWNEGSLTVLGALPDATNSVANSINNLGQVAGSAIVGSSNSEWHAVAWNGTTPTDLGSGQAYSINDLGQVVGNSGSGYGYATIWNGTTPTTLGLLQGATASDAWKINNSGLVIGSSLINGESHGTLWNGSVASDFGTNSRLYDINNLGVIVGSLNGRAALWSENTVMDLNTLLDTDTRNMGWVLNDASGINDNGWIIGQATNSTLGISGHAFLLAPVPEPETYCMLLMGLGLMGFVARRRNQQA